MYYIFFAHSSVSGQLYCIHVLAIVNSVEMNSDRVHVSFRIMVFSGYIRRSGIAKSYGSSILIFKSISRLLSIVAVTFYFPTSSVGGFPFLHTLSRIYCL